MYERPATTAVARFLGEADLLPARASEPIACTELGDGPLLRPADGAVTVMLRPEQVVPTPHDPAAGGTAEVIALSFHGQDALLTVRVASGMTLRARVLGGWLPRPGDRVGLGVRGTGWVLSD